MFGHRLWLLRHTLHLHWRHDEEGAVSRGAELPENAAHSRDGVEVLEFRVHDVFG